jgi:FkbM family methyltransferase
MKNYKCKYLGKELEIPESATKSLSSFTGKINKDGTVGLREKGKIEKFLQASLKVENATVLDIGANYASYSYITLFNPTAKVLAFEPIKELCETTKEILMLNNIERVKVFDFGLSNAEFEATLFERLQNNIGSSAINRKVTSSKAKATNTGYFKTLDSLNLQAADIVKIDVEGHELEVLEGAKETFKKHKPSYLQIEVNSGNIKSKIEKIQTLYFTPDEYDMHQEGPDFIFVKK